MLDWHKILFPIVLLRLYCLQKKVLKFQKTRPFENVCEILCSLCHSSHNAESVVTSVTKIG